MFMTDKSQNSGFLCRNTSNVWNTRRHLSYLGTHARRIFVDNILKRVTNSLAADLRRRTASRLVFGDSAPFFAFVGISLASGTGILTKNDEMEGVCWEIRVINAFIHLGLYRYLNSFLYKLLSFLICKM